MEDPFHVPQHTRRVKLRITPPETPYLHPLPPPPPPLNLSLSTTQQRSSAPIGPFTGYSSILSRSSFLSPAQDLLHDFFSPPPHLIIPKHYTTTTSLDDDSDSWTHHLPHSPTDSNLLSILHQVYKRYKVYHQQMQSAVSSFESVAGLANAAPFIRFAIKAVSKHFHSLKKAILDYINFSNTSSSTDDFRHNASQQHHQQQQQQQLQYCQQPVWRSQRGFPEKAVAVLRTWLFENFLHPYPTDTDKEMLARRTGLSRSQVSNWFTNARVRLWKPMVEEIHTLEKQRHEPLESEQHRKFVNVLADHFSSAPVLEKDSRRAEWIQNLQGNETTQMRIMSSSHQIDAEKHSSSSAYAPDEVTLGLPWSACGQAVPFWLAK